MANRIYAVIDTNVIASALLSKHQDSATVTVFMSVLNGTITPIFNDEILSEYMVDILKQQNVL